MQNSELIMQNLSRKNAASCRRCEYPPAVIFLSRKLKRLNAEIFRLPTVLFNTSLYGGADSADAK